MKKVLKFISLILCCILIFSSCTKASDKNINTIQQFISEKKYNECQKYISELEINELNEISAQVENIILTEFNSVCENEKIDFTKPYTLTAYDSDFTDTCRKLWNIASLLSIDESNERYQEYANMRFYAESNDFMRYRELYALMSNVNNDGYLEDLHKQLQEYTKSGDFSNFEDIYKQASAFDYSEFDPQEYMISEFRTAHDKIVKELKSVCNGFATNDSSVVASAINNMYDGLTVILRLSETLQEVRTTQTNIYNKLNVDKEINVKFDTEIKIFETEYSVSDDFAFDLLFGDDNSGFIDNSDIPLSTNKADEQMPLNDAIKIVISAINKTKNYKGDATAVLTKNINIDMTSFESETKINTANEITKSQVNQLLDQANGTRQQTRTFKNGADETSSFYDFVPPMSNNPSLNESDVESYTATKGSGGYVIVFNLKATETKKSQPQASVNTLVNGFEFDYSESVGDYKTYYSPYSAMFVINNDGYVSKLQYNISGVSDCTFYEKDEKLQAEFEFNEKYSYVFTY